MQQAIIPLQVAHILSQCTNIYELRIVGWVIAKAQSVLKLYNHDLREINMQFALNVAEVTIPARYLMGDKDKDTSAAKLGFGLCRKTVSYEYNGITAELNIIANPAFIKRGREKYVRFYVARELWHILLDFAKGYRIINLVTYLRLTSAYSVKIYLLLSQQRAERYLSMGELKTIVGAQQVESFSRGNNFSARVLEQAKKDLDRCSPTSFDYAPYKSGRGGRIVGYYLRPRANKPQLPLDGDPREAQITALRSRLDVRVKEYLIANFYATERDCESVEGLLEQLGDWRRQIEILDGVRHTAAKYEVANRVGYLIGALRKMC